MLRANHCIKRGECRVRRSHNRCHIILQLLNSQFPGFEVPCFSGDGFTCRPAKCTADTFYSPQTLGQGSSKSSKSCRVAHEEHHLFHQKHTKTPFFNNRQQCSFHPRPILPWSAAGTKPDPVTAKDVSLALQGDRLVVAVRDELRNNQGFITVGHVKSTEVVWGEWQLFSGDGAAFAPKVEPWNDEEWNEVCLTVFIFGLKLET